MTSDIDSLPAAARWLYGLAPSDFIAARTRLVSDLRAAGLTELAKEVTSLRRPTVRAAEMNRALRASGGGVEAMLVAARALRAGHQAALGGEPVDLGRLRRDHRTAASAIADQAERDQAEIQALLEAASLDEGLDQALRNASFATEPEPRIGFDLLSAHPDATVSSLAEARARRRAAAHPSGLELEPDPEADVGDETMSPLTGRVATEAPKPSKASTTKATAERAKTKSRDEGGDLEGMTKTHELALRRVEAAAKTVTKAEDRVEAAEVRLATARGHLAEATARLETAAAAEERARARLAAAQETEDPPPP